MQHALQIPPFGPLAEPSALIDIAVAADERGWDGVFLWDHLLSPVDGDWDIADAWTVLSAIAVRTRRIRIGPMVTPLPRRRITTVARQATTLDRLSHGRLTIGVGFGSNRSSEFDRLGEITDARARAAALDEGLELLARLWTGEAVTYEGPQTHLTGVRFTPGPLQQPRIPIWVAATTPADGPVRRAARWDGVVLTDMSFDGAVRLVDRVHTARPPGTFEVAVPTHPRGFDLATLDRIGATWALHSFWPGHQAAQLLRFIELGPPA